ARYYPGMLFDANRGGRERQHYGLWSRHHPLLQPARTARGLSQSMKLELYVIPQQSGRVSLFIPPEAHGAAESSDRIRHAIERLTRSQSRLTAWVGRSLRTVHDYYIRLEDKIDPVERVLKAMATTNQFVVYTQVPAKFYRELRRQRGKHVFWFSIDFLLTA